MHRPILTATVVTALTVIGTSASAQMIDEPYRFPSTDRAGLAVIIDRAEDGEATSPDDEAAASRPDNYTILQCGGPSGEASATSESACIIMNDSAGSIGVEQEGHGDQTASTDTEVSAETAGEVSDALESLVEE